MILPLEFDLLATDRARALQAEAAAARLLAVARCCRPGAWTRAAGRVRAAARALADGGSRSSGAGGCCVAT